MMLGMSLETFTLLHVVLGLAGIGSGGFVLFGLLTLRRFDRWTALFLATTVATSLTGFGFPFAHLLPPHVVGILSLLILALAIVARYAFRLAGPWRRVYVVSATLALYFNVFVAVAQAFLRVPTLKALAPHQTEPPFAVAQGAVLVAFLVLGGLATLRWHPEA